MTSTMPAAARGEEIPDAEALTQIVGDVFTGLLGTEVEPPLFASHRSDVLPVSATVSVSGEWSAKVIFACSESLARRVTADMLETGPSEVTDDDVRDVIGEVVNVIGGNVKSIMPGPSALSLPQASLAGEPSCPIDVASLRLELAWHDEPIRITVWTQPQPAPTEATNEEMKS
jgi:chemotaxis protein CheX